MDTSPKRKVTSKFSELFGADHEVEVRGTRVKGRFGGYFLAELCIDGNSTARARHNDWRTAYRLLSLEVERLWERGTRLV